MMRFPHNGRSPVILILALMMLWLAIWLGVLVAAAPAQHALWLSLALLPLLIVTLAVWRNTKGGYAWSGFLSLGYLAQGITVVWTDATQLYAGAVEIILSVLMFAAASSALRARRQPGQR